jgi:hypothetical protein
MRRVILESPYRAILDEDPIIGLQSNIDYLQDCVKDSLSRGEAPFASHQMYTQALNDSVAVDRQLGIEAGFEWHASAVAMVVYTDRGISNGMAAGIRNANRLRLPVEYRRLGGIWQ